MHAHRPRRTAPARAAALSLVVLAAACYSAATLTAAGAAHSLKLGGMWSGSYSGAVAGSFTLHWTQTGSSLKGAITLSNPHGTYPITGHVNGTSIKFGAVGVGALYSGSVSASGLAMSGNWTSGPGGGTWKAHEVMTQPKVKVKKKK